MSDVIQNTRAVCERNRRDYEELAKMAGQTADTTAPDPRCICPDCAGTGTQVVNTGIIPEHGNLEQESCDRCGGTGTGAPHPNEEEKTMTKGDAIRTAMASTIILFTKAAAAQGQSGPEIWRALQAGVMEVSGVSAPIASCIIRDAWENEAKSKEVGQ